MTPPLAHQLEEALVEVPMIDIHTHLVGGKLAARGLHDVTLARELPNLSLAGYWWHNFFSGAMRQVMAERLEMLPISKQIGFSPTHTVSSGPTRRRPSCASNWPGCSSARSSRGITTGKRPATSRGRFYFESPQSLLGMAPRTSLGP